MTTSFWQRANQGLPISCDIAIIGGGIIGTSTAFWLKKIAPSQKVILLESRTIGWGASGRNAGFLLQGTSSNYAVDIQTYGEDIAKSLWMFTLENRMLVSEQFNANAINLQPSGSLIASGNKQEQETLQQSATHLLQLGADAVLWSREKLEATCNTTGFHGALYVPNGASLNPLKLLQQISGLSGVRILEQHPVTSVSHEGNHCFVSTPLRAILANRVFFALNAYLPELLPETAPYIHPIRAQMLASSPQSMWLHHPIYSHNGYYYIRQAPDGSVLLGGARHLYKDEETGYKDLTTPHLQNALEAYYRAHFPTSPPTVSRQTMERHNGIYPRWAAPIFRNRSTPRLILGRRLLMDTEWAMDSDLAK